MTGRQWLAVQRRERRALISFFAQRRATSAAYVDDWPRTDVMPPSVGFIAAIRFRPIRPRVSGVSGVAKFAM